jgi:23S rRNA (cytidine1920-2'-O)/16S rRNA (cytidine1409-2'-O)-methyltransferase
MRRFASRSGEKLQAALDAWQLDLTGWSCVDFGCNVGGFTDCLLQAGARKVYAIDTGYGQLAWTLRNDPRVVVMERTNALHCRVEAPVDLAVIDVAWTPQQRILPAAMQWIKPDGAIISLLKPHYELTKLRRRKPHAPLEADDLAVVESQLQSCLEQAHLELRDRIQSPIVGKGGNTEQLLLLYAQDR